MHEPHMLDVEGSVYQAKWSHDGQHIAVTAAPTPLTDDYYMHQRIKIVKFHDWGVVAEINNPGKIGEITWSPDDRQLAFISAADINDPIAGRIMTAPASGGPPTLITEGYEGQFDDIAWEDDKTLRYLASKGVWSEYGEMRPDGSRQKVIVEPGGPVMYNFALSEDGRHTAFVGDSPQHPREVFYMGRRDKEPKRMTNSNDWLVNVKLADQEVVTWEARDGMELEGVLIKPLNYQEGQRYPLITDVHGGPEAHENNGWKTGYSTLGQVAAAYGYAVFYPNYRGSTGYGVEFAKSSQADPAGKEFDDIVDGVKHLVKSGIADEDKVGVTGGSYGGYATGWLTTKYSDQFAAGVMFVGISNKVSKVGTTDIPDEEYYVHARKRPWDNWQFFLERSPIYHAENSNTPLLIMHGEEDPRVNVGQSHEMYRHLKLRGNAPVRLVLYPGEGHGNRNATARYDYNLRSLRWFNHYLMGEGGDKPPTEIKYETREP
jgi:dipeptidyl aminopeptidase/acylaminoacyl peptidase